MGVIDSPLRGRIFRHGINLNMISIIFALCYVIISPPEVSARGRLMEPTQRSSLWTRGFNSPINDDDTGLNCGGRWVQHGINNGKCGVCGDPYDASPRQNEPGGTYANGIIANTYTTYDESILVVVDIQSALGGYFEFRICPHNDPHTSVSQKCLDRYQLRVWDTITKEPKYQFIPKRIGLHRLRVEIPKGMTCTQCVLQWKWHTAKDWGVCPDGNARLGCGPQEEFYNCADIAIEQATSTNQRLTLPDVTSTNSNQQLNFEPSFDKNNVFSNIPISFLPHEIWKAGNLGPVISPKFDFFDPSTFRSQLQSTTKPEVTTISKEAMQAQDNSNNINNVVELKFNDNSVVQQTSTSNTEVTYQSTGGSSASNVDITISSIVPNDASSFEPKPTASAFVDISTEQTQTVSSSSLASETSPLNQPITSTSGEASSTSVEATSTFGEATSTSGEITSTSGEASSTSVGAASTFGEATSTSGEITSTSGEATSTYSQTTSTSGETTTDQSDMSTSASAIGDMNTSGMVVEVSMGANDVGPTQDTPIVSSQATSPEESTTSVDQSSSTNSQSTTTTTTTTTTHEAPVPMILRSRLRPAVKINAEQYAEMLSHPKKIQKSKMLIRKRRQAPPPPPPPAGASSSGAAPNKQPPPAPSSNNQGPDYAPQPAQQSSRTVSFGGLIGDSFSRGGTQTQRSFMTQQDFQQSTGSRQGSIPGEALSEMTMTGAQQPSGPVDMQGYPPDMMLAPGPARSGGFDMTGGSTLAEAMFLDPSLAVGGSLLDTPIDANPASFAKPDIPPPPKQSSAELEAAIIGAPALSSAVSDTHVSSNAADLVGASYIPELSEGRSNQAETSTAARHGTMIVPVEQSQRGGGRQVEYLAGSKGTSIGETAADTRAEIRSATMSLARFGYQPTAEQVLSGNIGIHHPTENLDTTNLEPVGPSPNAAAGAAAPGILSAILGGQPTTVTDASLDPAVQKTREELIRQLGEAMGVIGTGKAESNPTTGSSGGIAVGGLTSGNTEQQQIIITGNSQQVVNPQVGDMGIGLDAGMFGMDAAAGNQNTAGNTAGGTSVTDMFQGLGLQGMNMQNMDLQTLFGAADAAVNSQTVSQTAVSQQQQQSNQQTVVDAAQEQNMFGQSATAQNTPTAAAQTQKRQPQTAFDLIDMGMPGMTVEEIMTLLNSEQPGGAAATLSGSSSSSLTSASSSNTATGNNVGIDLESAMMGGTTSISSKSSSSSQKSVSSTTNTGGSSSASAESLMFGANSINEKPRGANDKLIGQTAQSLNEMSTSSLEALLMEATGGNPKREKINKSVQPPAVPSTSATSSSSSSVNLQLNADALLTAPLDKMSTAQLEALLASSSPTQVPTTTAAPVTTTATSSPVNAGQSTTESRETAMIKAALRRAVFDATGTEFDFSQMTQAEMNDMVQMFGGLQSLEQYMTPDIFGPEPAASVAVPNINTTPAPIQETPIVQTQAPTIDVPTSNTATPLNTNIDFAAMQQFLNPAMFGPDVVNFGFGQQNTAHGSGTYQQAEVDLNAMMNAFNPVAAQPTDPTISLADLLAGNINMGQTAQTQAQATQVTDAQLSVNDVQVQTPGQAGSGSEIGWPSGSSGDTATDAASTAVVSATSQGEVVGTENMIWDPVQLQWITPNGSIIKDSTTSQQTALDVQATVSNQVANNTSQQQTVVNEMSSISSSTSSMSSSSSTSSSSSPNAQSMLDSFLSMESSGSVSVNASATGSQTLDVSPIVGDASNLSQQVATVTVPASDSLASSVGNSVQDIAQSSLSDLIPVGEQIQPQMTEKASPSTVNVDPSPTASTAGSDIGLPDIQTTSIPLVKSPRPPVGVPNQREVILMSHEMQKKQELELLLQKQRDELRRLEEQRMEQRRKMMAEKQRIEYEKQQLALKKQQMELAALRQEQLRQRQILEQQRKQLQEERMRIEQQRIKELEAAKQKAIEEEKRRIREEQQRLRDLEIAKQQAAEKERQRIELERRKKAQAELSRRRAAEQERLRIEEERRRLEEERMRQEAAAAAAAKAKAEAEAAAAAAAAAQAEIEARERAAASMVVGLDTGIVADATSSGNATSGNASESFTPIGAVGGQLTDADAATAMAWQAVVKAAQIQASGGSADPNALITQQQEQLMQQQQLMSMMQSPEWLKIIEQATGKTTTPAPTTPAPDLGGFDTAALMKMLQEQAQAPAPTTTPAPPTTTAKPKRKAPIRPDPNTREFVRNMFIDNMTPGVDPLSILIGLTPEMLMKSGVNPLIANSGDLARIVPAVERALGISLKKIPIPTGPGGRPLTPQPSGFQMLNIRSGPGGGSPGSQRREFLMQQQMMNEMMTMLGIGPEPLEPGDPGYRGPGARGGRGGARGHPGGTGVDMGGHSMGGHSMGGGMGGHSMGGHSMGGGMGGHSFGGMGEPMGGHSMGGMGRSRGGGGPGAGLNAQMGMLGL